MQSVIITGMICATVCFIFWLSVRSTQPAKETKKEKEERRNGITQ